MSGAVGGRGAPGPQGPQGLPGAAATIAVGTVTTGAPGSSAAVTNVGTQAAAVFDFVIPEGLQGATGAQGPQPIFGTPVASQLPEGSAPTAAISGAGSAADPYVLSLGIPKGDTGAQGATGATGAQGPQGPSPVFGTPTATQLPSGSAPTASITGSGTSQDPYLLALGIPLGNAGPQGPTGPTGPSPVFGTPTASQLPAGTAPTASISGAGTAASPYILAIGIPKGDTGSQGVQGPTGPQAQFGTPSASALSPGSAPSVAISGQGTPASPYLLAFGIPKGQTGATGPQGPQGPSGTIPACRVVCKANVTLGPNVTDIPCDLIYRSTAGASYFQKDGNTLKILKAGIYFVVYKVRARITTTGPTPWKDCLSKLDALLATYDAASGQWTDEYCRDSEWVYQNNTGTVAGTRIIMFAAGDKLELQGAVTTTDMSTGADISGSSAVTEVLNGGGTDLEIMYLDVAGYS